MNDIFVKDTADHNLESRIKKYTHEYVDFLKDESNLYGDEIDEIFFPISSEELSKYFKIKVEYAFCISGARTGVVGGASPSSDQTRKTSLVSLSKCKYFGEIEVENGQALIEVGAGVSLFELNSYLEENYSEYYFPVDPTEWSASFGGMASTNASGARSFYFSSIRKWISELEVVLVDGAILNLKRGHDKLEGNNLKFKSNTYSLDEILKPETKNSVGYYCRPDCDVLDLFIGAEGTLGVITKLKIKLEKKSKDLISILQFFKTAEEALKFVVNVRDILRVNCISLEFLDSKSIAIALESTNPILDQIKSFVDGGVNYVVFSEYLYGSEDELSNLLISLEEIVLKSGGLFENSICGLDNSKILAIKKFRHAVPEGINKIITERKRLVPELRKVATDMAVPDNFLLDVYSLYQTVLSEKGLEFSIVGHAGNNHFHVNLLPKTLDEMNIALEVYELFAKEVVKMGGAVSAEHGIGRIKKKFLTIQYSEDTIKTMKEIKSIFDPDHRLNSGVLLN